MMTIDNKLRHTSSNESQPLNKQLEKQLENMSVRAQKELILLHKQESPLIRNTLEWLNIRPWCSGHHHIR